MFQCGGIKSRLSQLISTSHCVNISATFTETRYNSSGHQWSSRDKSVHFFHMSRFGSRRLWRLHFYLNAGFVHPAAIWDEFILENRTEEREKGKSVPMEGDGSGEQWWSGGGSESWELQTALHCEIHSNSSTCWHPESRAVTVFQRSDSEKSSHSLEHRGSCVNCRRPQSETASFCVAAMSGKLTHSPTIPVFWGEGERRGRPLLLQISKWWCSCFSFSRNTSSKNNSPSFAL